MHSHRHFHSASENRAVVTFPLHSNKQIGLIAAYRTINVERRHKKFLKVTLGNNSTARG